MYHTCRPRRDKAMLSYDTRLQCYASARCVLRSRLWRHHQILNRLGETRSRYMNIVRFIVSYGLIVSCKENNDYPVFYPVHSQTSLVREAYIACIAAKYKHTVYPDKHIRQEHINGDNLLAFNQISFSCRYSEAPLITALVQRHGPLRL